MLAQHLLGMGVGGIDQALHLAEEHPEDALRLQAGLQLQAQLLAQWLRTEQAHEVLLTREPGGTPIGVRLRELLLANGTLLGPRTEALLFAADRADHVESSVRPALARGAVVVTDRYADSSIAYQGAGRALDGDEVARLSGWATGGLVPDLTVLLDLPPEIQKVRRAADTRRGDDDRLEALPDDFHDRVRQGFLELARRDPRRYLVIDASEPRSEIQSAIRGRVRDLMPISPHRREELAARLAREEEARRRRAAAEAEVLRLDANLRGRSRDEARARQEELRAARLEAERQVREEADRTLQAAREAAEAAQAETERLEQIARQAKRLTLVGKEAPQRDDESPERVEDQDDQPPGASWSADVLGHQPGRPQ